MDFKFLLCRTMNTFNLVGLVFCVIFSIIFLNELQRLMKTKNESSTLYTGEMGAPVHLNYLSLSRNELVIINQGWRKYSFNQYVSDMIPYNRSLPDLRQKWCKQPRNYLKNLPVTDVIICFHNEAWSTLLRTVHSVLNRSPEHLLGQVILVNDFSDMAHLKIPLENYFAKFLNVKIVYSLKREGIARARLLGMKHSTAPVLTFLDSHCECTEGWLEPLLDRIARNSLTIVAPFIDIINMTTFEYVRTNLTKRNYMGGFTWNLEYSWISRLRKEAQSKPLETPTIAGGLFAVDRKFFEHLGTYDPGFEIWGAENLELSFKAWMCGGRLEIVYCSRVGHIFRDVSPMRLPDSAMVIQKNNARLAEVWMDGYANIFYKSLGKSFDLSSIKSDVRERQELRKNLGCKSFKWYLENVYPEKFIPASMGAFILMKTDLCLDAKDEVGPVNITKCDGMGGSQFWMYSYFSEIRQDKVCLTANGNEVILTRCYDNREDSQWNYDDNENWISNQLSKKCLTLSWDNKSLLMEKCLKQNWRQLWIVK